MKAMERFWRLVAWCVLYGVEFEADFRTNSAFSKTEILLVMEFEELFLLIM